MSFSIEPVEGYLSCNPNLSPTPSSFMGVGLRFQSSPLKAILFFWPLEGYLSLFDCHFQSSPLSFSIEPLEGYLSLFWLASGKLSRLFYSFGPFALLVVWYLNLSMTDLSAVVVHLVPLMFR